MKPSTAPLPLLIVYLTTCLLQSVAAGEPLLRAPALRHSRSVGKRTLDDPNDCVHNCNLEEQKRTAGIVAEHTFRKITLKANSAESSAELDQQLGDNLAKQFNETCQSAKTAYSCVEACPKTQLRQLALIRRKHYQDIACEVHQFSDARHFVQAANCTHKTVLKQTCAAQCGPSQNVSDAAGLAMDETQTPIEVSFEGDAKKNTGTINKTCAVLACHLKCNKPLIVNNCGQEAYDFYVRAEKRNARDALAILQLLSAVSQPVCQDIA